MKITIIENGPALIDSGTEKLIEVKQGEDTLAAQSKIYLCRCGKSKNQPFCDGSHKVKNEN